MLVSETHDVIPRDHVTMCQGGADSLGSLSSHMVSVSVATRPPQHHKQHQSPLTFTSYRLSNWQIVNCPVKVISLTISYLWKTNTRTEGAFRLHLVTSHLFSLWPVLIWIKHYIIFQAQHKHKYPVYCLLTRPRPEEASRCQCCCVPVPAPCSWQDQDECAQYYAKYVDTHRLSPLVATDPPGPGPDVWLAAPSQAGDELRSWEPPQVNQHSGDMEDAKMARLSTTNYLKHAGDGMEPFVLLFSLFALKLDQLKHENTPDNKSCY